MNGVSALTPIGACAGDEVIDPIAAVLRGDPDWQALPPDLPPPIRLLLQRCLPKDCGRRIPDCSIAIFLRDGAAALNQTRRSPVADLAITTDAWQPSPPGRSSPR